MDNDTVTYLVPVVQLPINATQCMCQSMDSLARDVQLNQLNQLPGLNFQYSCARARGKCDTVNCVVAIAARANYTASMAVDSCHNPPAISIVVLDSGENEVYSGSFDHSQNVDIPCFGLTCTLEITIEHHQYSMDVTVSPYGYALLSLSLSLPPVLPPTPTPSRGQVADKEKKKATDAG